MYDRTWTSVGLVITTPTLMPDAAGETVPDTVIDAVPSYAEPGAGAVIVTVPAAEASAGDSTSSAVSSAAVIAEWLHCITVLCDGKGN